MAKYSRRLTTNVVSILFILALSCLGFAREVQAASCPSLVVVSFGGGSYQKSHIDAFETPFSIYGRLPVRSEVWDANYGTLKSMIDSGQVEWGVVDVPAADFARARDEGLLQRIQPPVSGAGFMPGTVEAQGVGNVYWATVLAYKKSTFPHGAPNTWRDFFDLKRFPGPRAMYDDPRANIEFALLADGVAPKDIYPLTPAKIDRAFAKLSTIKGAVKVWWGDGSRPVQMLLNNEVVMSTAWSGRIFASKQASIELGYTWNGAALELDYWVVPKGALCPDASSAFIAYASSPAAMAAQANEIGYGPVNAKALDFVEPNVRPQLPTYPANFSRSFVIDANNWRAIEDAVHARWTKWKNSN